MLTRIIYGARISVIVGLSAATLGTIVSAIIGITSAYLGGTFDMIVQRFVDTWMCFPALIISMVLVIGLGASIWSIILALPIAAVAYSVAIDDVSIIDRVNEGFAALNKLPEWYQYLLFIAVSASFGLKSADKIMGLKKGKK
jgi:ABC-type dipeptide/oligopeptide/nickel transport system permease subunit